MLRSSSGRSLVFALLAGSLSGCGVSQPTAVVDSRSVNYALTGTGRSVVLESGLGDGIEPWQLLLASDVSGAALFAYDRAGYGLSDPSASFCTSKWCM